ncbi:major facilitator superfamily MFS_1 [Beutenbergia cavernae DSM 12333]|uniref:Major facilitator superfamily MFS_1 n=1 Tax=Beutenbergia cavernae (strain ATCC BAA-8 / DSM 12333 / CCUG 43141 / JCM 11478 / NBRC 16432 / NCIMB 13614 / HKI 0122) TaxID=471853 RepID=C5C427_BEUC1|nr:MFS transporter [Beutenbergia cavernae]ACQ79940.1 major facilitator superfamily MFS_1 [Beutenbergia cavernae DSM 12333]
MSVTTASATGSLWGIREIRATFVVSFAGLTSFSLTLAALPAWAGQLGHPESVVGTITGVMLATTVVTQLLAPRLMRRFTIRSLLVVGSLLLGLPTPLYLVASGLPVLYGLSAVRGVGFALVTVVAALAIPRAAPPERRGEAIGIFGLSAAIPMMVGISGGAALTLGGSFAVVAVLGALPVLALAVVSGLPAERAGAAGSTPLRRVLRALALPALLLVVTTAAGGGLVTLLPLQRPEGSVAALALLAFGAVGMIARWRIGTVLDRFGPRLVLPVLVGCAAVGLVLLAVGLTTAGAGAVTAGAAVFGLAYGGLQTVTLDMSYRTLPAADASAASAVWNAAFDAGTAVGSALLGFVGGTAWGGDGALVASAAAVAAVGTAAAWSARSAARSTDPEGVA